jgi:hypothetical protein
MNNLPFIDASLLNTALPKISILPFIDVSLDVSLKIYRREFISTSLSNVAVPKTDKREFMNTSPFTKIFENKFYLALCL